jgi:phosphohistidine swiveling domain-containing protein
MEEKDELTLNDYIRLFSFHGAVPLIISHEFVKAAKALNYLAFGGPDSWISYMHKDAVDSAGEEGLALYSNTARYENFKKGLYDSFEELKKETEDILIAPEVTAEQVSNLLRLSEKYRSYYTKTEFFYTDKAFEAQESQPSIRENFASFEKLKLDGRSYLNQALLLPESFLAKLLKKLSKQYDIPHEHLETYTTGELHELFNDKKVPNEEIADRAHHLTYMRDGKITTLVGKTARDQIEKLKASSTEDLIRGKTASRGKVVGKARVIKVSIKEYDKVKHMVDAMEKGEVLIVETTEPTIMLACQKAAAIVTNQGGMMSHAAIVSRELHIPCIVGTGDATHKINTGDLVEVDADKAVVTVLERVQ